MIREPKIAARSRIQSAVIGLWPLAALLFFSALPARAYSVLTHQAIVDTAWDTVLRPALLERFPNATPDDLKQAHAYAYGGAIIQDLGYYPHGSHLFSDLVHYVRSGDFVLALLRDSKNLNDYAFALGAVAHYAADDNGHRIAVNRAVPMLYPKLRKKYGDVITYEQNPAAHLKTEFGFDVLQVAKARYAPDSYHDFIGFEVATPLLEQAFTETYALPLQAIFSNLEVAIRSYRYDIRTLIPEATRVAWSLKKTDIRKDVPGITREKFLYNLSKASFRKEWGRDYQKPGIGARILAFLIRIFPKVGPLSALAFKMPTPAAEALFMKSFNESLDDYKRLIQEQRAGKPRLPNNNFDTGEADPPGSYFLADSAYAQLVDLISKNQCRLLTPALRDNILAYYSDPTAPFVTRKKPKDWTRLNQELEGMRTSSACAIPAAPVQAQTNLPDPPPGL